MMQVTVFSFFSSVVWSSVLASVHYLCRKRPFFIRQLGITNILLLYLFPIVRMLAPYEFSFARGIPAKGLFQKVNLEMDLGRIEAGRNYFLPMAAILWAAVSIGLMVRFIWQYQASIRELSTYSICKDEQCGRVLNWIWKENRKQADIQIRRSEGVSIPMGIGVFKKFILLPDRDYSDSELYYILRHEYTHFQNKDPLIKILAYLYWCIFWWNPVIYLLRKDLAQILEIKCDLDVTDRMEPNFKAEYLATIVNMLKNATTNNPAESFYGTTALSSRRYGSEIRERFWLVTEDAGHQAKNAAFQYFWYVAAAAVVLLSYTFVLQPDYGDPGALTVTGSEASGAADYAISVQCKGGTYSVYVKGK